MRCVRMRSRTDARMISLLRGDFILSMRGNSASFVRSRGSALAWN